MLGTSHREQRAACIYIRNASAPTNVKLNWNPASYGYYHFFHFSYVLDGVIESS